jgi:transcriptional regulator with XRE-family HTH domain
VSGKPPVGLGTLGWAVVENVKRLRWEKRLHYSELSEKLADVGRPIPPLGLRRIERGARRIDVDELGALAQVLGVPMAVLLDGGAAEAHRSMCLRWLLAEDDHRHASTDSKEAS